MKTLKKSKEIIGTKVRIVATFGREEGLWKAVWGVKNFPHVGCGGRSTSVRFIIIQSW